MPELSQCDRRAKDDFCSSGCEQPCDVREVDAKTVHKKLKLFTNICTFMGEEVV